MKLSVQIVVHPDDDTEGSPVVRELFALNRDELKHEAGALYQRTIKEFADLRPMGDDSLTLGEQAEGRVAHA